MQKRIDEICDFIVEKTKNFNGGVIGLSGGIDSSLVAYLAVRALGKEKVHGMCLPYSTEQSSADGLLVGKNLGLKGRSMTFIQHMVDPFLVGKDYSALTKGNLKARIRMCCLYMEANERNMLVLGTTNKSELAIGYYTKWGDGAVDIEPIAHLTKTDVWAMARVLGVPDQIITKAPSAELWDGQTDENELGFSYAILDQYIEGKPVSPEAKKKIEARIKSSEHKRVMPPNLLVK